jgi:hypothetical protein
VYRSSRLPPGVQPDFDLALVRAESRLKQPQVVWSELRHIADYFAEMAVTELEQESRVRQFRDELADGWTPVDGKTSDRHESGVRHLLVRLRAVIRWGIGQRTPWLKSSPFHRYGLAIETSDDTRTRRLRVLKDGRTEEEALLAACRLIADPDHKFAGRALERRILGALYLGGRGSELNRVRLEHVCFAPAKGWPYVVFLGRERGGGKAMKDRHIPFDPHGPLADVLAARRFLKAPHDFIFGDDDGLARQPLSGMDDGSAVGARSDSGRWARPDSRARSGTLARRGAAPVP